MRVGDRVRVRVEVPRGGMVKRELGGGVEYLSPVPCPFNYGCLPEVPAPDGDPMDALVIGPSLPAGSWVEGLVWGRVRFVDDGVSDDKLVVGAVEPEDAEWRRIAVFFRVYAGARALLNLARGRAGRTTFLGVER